MSIFLVIIALIVVKIYLKKHKYGSKINKTFSVKDFFRSKNWFHHQKKSIWMLRIWKWGMGFVWLTVGGHLFFSLLNSFFPSMKKTDEK